MADAPIFLDGSLTLRFETRAVPPWPTLSGIVRPATAAERRRAERELAKLKADDAEGEVRVRSEFYARHVVAWSAAAGPVTADLISRLPAPIFDQLEAIVTGYDALLPN